MDSENKEVKVTKVNGLVNSNGKPLKLGFNRNTLYMRDIKSEEDKEKEEAYLQHLKDNVFDYSRTCCHHNAPCYKGCTNQENKGDFHVCSRKVRKIKQMMKDQPMLTLDSIGIPKKYHDYYYKAFEQLDKEENEHKSTT